MYLWVNEIHTWTQYRWRKPWDSRRWRGTTQWWAFVGLALSISMPSYREHCLGETLEQTHRYLFMVYKGRQPPMDTCNNYKFVAAIKVLTLECEGVISVTSLKAKLLHTIVRGAGVRLSHGNDWMTSTSWNIVEAVWHSRIILNVIIKCTQVVYILLKLPFFFRCKDVLLTVHHFYRALCIK